MHAWISWGEIRLDHSLKFSCYILVMQPLFRGIPYMEYRTCHLYFVSIHMSIFCNDAGRNISSWTPVMYQTRKRVFDHISKNSSKAGLKSQKLQENTTKMKIWKITTAKFKCTREHILGYDWLIKIT